MINRYVVFTLNTRDTYDLRHQLDGADPRNVIDIQCYPRIDRHSSLPGKGHPAAAQIDDWDALRCVNSPLCIHMTNCRHETNFDAEQTALLKPFDKLRHRDAQRRKAPIIAAMAAMYTKEAIVTAIASCQYIQILTRAGDDRNQPLIHRHSDDEFVTDNILDAAGVARSPLLGVFKEYFKPLSNG